MREQPRRLPKGDPGRRLDLFAFRGRTRNLLRQIRQNHHPFHHGKVHPEALVPPTPKRKIRIAVSRPGRRIDESTGIETVAIRPEVFVSLREPRRDKNARASRDSMAVNHIVLLSDACHVPHRRIQPHGFLKDRPSPCEFGNIRDRRRPPRQLSVDLFQQSGVNFLMFGQRLSSSGDRRYAVVSWPPTSMVTISSRSWRSSIAPRCRSRSTSSGDRAAGYRRQCPPLCDHGVAGRVDHLLGRGKRASRSGVNRIGAPRSSRNFPQVGDGLRDGIA